MGRVKFDVKRTSIADITELPQEAIDALTEKEKRTLGSRLVSAANKRIKRAQEKDRDGDYDIPKMSLKGKTGADLDVEIGRARSFLKDTQRKKVPTRLQELIDTPYETWVKYDKKTLQEKVKLLAKTANSRIRALRKAGVPSPALSTVEKEGGTITTANKNINELRYEYSRAKKFLSAKTSTVSGSKDWQKRSINTVNKVYNLDIGVENFELLWETWSMAAEYNEKYKIKEYKYKILETINNIIVDYGRDIQLTRDDIMDILVQQNLIEQAYKEKVEEGEDPSDYISFE